jgi:hypothetical protein
VKIISKPQTEKHKLYAPCQEGTRKDVECAFGVLQSCFDIVNHPARLWNRDDVVNIMRACVILHNMIVEDEKELVRTPLDLNENPSATIVLPPEVSKMIILTHALPKCLIETRQSGIVLHIDNSGIIWLSIYGTLWANRKLELHVVNQSITFYHIMYF